MSNKVIQERAFEERRLHDHIAWRGICMRCGLKKNVFAEQIKALTGDVYSSHQGVELECSSPRCKGKVMLKGRMAESRAVHLNEIKRR